MTTEPQDNSASRMIRKRINERHTSVDPDQPQHEERTATGRRNELIETSESTKEWGIEAGPQDEHGLLSCNGSHSTQLH